MSDEEETIELAEAESFKETQKSVKNPRNKDRNNPTEGSNLLNSNEENLQETQTESSHLQRLRQKFTCPPHKITKGITAVFLWIVISSVIDSETIHGGNQAGIMMLFFCACVGGALSWFINLCTLSLCSLPLLPPLLGMTLAGFLVRNIPVISNYAQLEHKWFASLRSIALSLSLVRVSLELDSEALKKLKGVCVRLSMGPCLVEACASAVLAHFLMGLPWRWGFILSFVLGAVSPAVVIPSMRHLQKKGYGVDKGVPTLLMAAGNFDDILAITGFNTCLLIAFSTGSTILNILRGVVEVHIGIATGCLLGFFIQYFPSSIQGSLVRKRAILVLVSSVLVVLSSVYVVSPGSGELLCTFVMVFTAGVGWTKDKVKVKKVIKDSWDISQLFLFVLFGAEVSVESLSPETVGLCVAILGLAVLIRIWTTFLMVCLAGFNIKEKIFISFAWLPKATVQAAVGSVAMDLARSHDDIQLEDYGMAVLTMAFVAILITVLVGNLLIGLLGPRLLQKAEPQNEVEEL